MNEKVAIEQDIIERLNHGPHRFMDMVGLVGGYRHERKLDRALQRLRRRGLIRYTGQKRGWEIVQETDVAS